MKKLEIDSLPHLVDCLCNIAAGKWFTFWSRQLSRWWGVELGRGCSFQGLPRFRRHPQSKIKIGLNCKFNSSSVSNLIGINRPCIVATLSRSADIITGSNCGFSGTVIGCAKQITIGDNVRCGANTLITDTDWHSDDPRTGRDAPVIIGNNVWLGVNVIVLKGVAIGENTLVGAGSLVTRSLPANVFAAGAPAKVIRHL